MDRLSEHRKETSSFLQCQLCGKEYSDITSLRMWQECNDSDNPEPGNFLVVGHCCKPKILEHPRAYLEIPWGKGEPGAFILLCGDCPFRAGFKCTHPHLKANGGGGLLLNTTNPMGFGPVHVNYGGGRGAFVDFSAYSMCEGHPTQKPVKLDTTGA